MLSAIFLSKLPIGMHLLSQMTRSNWTIRYTFGLMGANDNDETSKQRSWCEEKIQHLHIYRGKNGETERETGAESHVLAHIAIVQISSNTIALYRKYFALFEQALKCQEKWRCEHTSATDVLYTLISKYSIIIKWIMSITNVCQTKWLR